MLAAVLLLMILIPALVIAKSVTEPPKTKIENENKIAETLKQNIGWKPEPLPEFPRGEKIQEEPIVVKIATVALSDAKAFIYQHESGNNPTALNQIGCYGLGQDCNGIVQSLCGADYACQDNFFTAYATRRYGGWEQARNFWLVNKWW